MAVLLLVAAKKERSNLKYWTYVFLFFREGGQPYKLDPLSLGTAGATDLGNVIPKVSPSSIYIFSCRLALMCHGFDKISAK